MGILWINTVSTLLEVFTLALYTSLLFITKVIELGADSSRLSLTLATSPYMISPFSLMFETGL